MYAIKKQNKAKKKTKKKCKRLDSSVIGMHLSTLINLNRNRWRSIHPFMSWPCFYRWQSISWIRSQQNAYYKKEEERKKISDPYFDDIGDGLILFDWMCECECVLYSERRKFNFQIYEIELRLLMNNYEHLWLRSLDVIKI